MAATAVRAGTRRLKMGVFIALQIGVPASVYLIRAVTGEKLAPWGWQMFS